MRVLAMVSGAGGDFLALERARKRGLLNHSVAGVISTRPNSRSVDLANRQGFRAQLVSRKGKSREAFDAEIQQAMEDVEFDLCVLAGYRYILPPSVVRGHAGKIVNSHHSILPASPGLYSKEERIGSHEKLLGATVHMVDEGVDTGEILAQAAFPNPGMECLERALRLYRLVQDILIVQVIRQLAGYPCESAVHVWRDILFAPAVPQAILADVETEERESC